MSRIEIDKEAVRKSLRESVREVVFSRAATVKKEDFVNRLLQVGTEQREKVILALLGVDTTWGRVELYKSNGHVTQLQSWIMQEIGSELETFVRAEARKVFEKDQPKVRAAIKEAIAREARSMCSNYQIERQMRTMISEYINDCGKDILEEVIKEVLPVGVMEEKNDVTV